VCLIFPGRWQALAATYPYKQWIIPPICPEEYGQTFLEQIGFVPNTLNQVQMERALELS
jgi:hypothetical protein